jgi:glyoxylase-like metal-dependent hydrolase (beta-lactamase superfamily II)
MSDGPVIRRFDSSNGARIYRIPMTVFPNGFVGYAYVVLGGAVPLLIDTGSGFGTSNDDLLAGIAALKSEFGEALDVRDIKRILITHGHIDHFGGLAFMVEQTGGARVGVHALDRRVLTNYEERVGVATKDLRVYLDRAGISQERRQALIDMYSFGKRHFSSVPVDFSLDEDIAFEGGLRFIHTPGHCPGQVCILIGDVLLSADHVLSHTTPHQAPESITRYMGLGHYRDALRKLLPHAEHVRVTLGGHEEPIHDLSKRITEILVSHERTVNRILDILRTADRPLTTAGITDTMYPERKGYDELLALEEAGAHIEYLYERGFISVANLADVETDANPPLQYVLS